MRKLCVLGIAVLGLAGCIGTFGGGDELDTGDDEVTSVKLSVKAYTIANQVILATRPKATQLLVDQVNIVLTNNNILDRVVKNVESRMMSPMTNGTPPTTCPYLTKSQQGTALNCHYLVDRAVDDTLVSSSGLKSSVEQDVGNNHGHELAQGEQVFVVGWGKEAILSGIDVGAAQAVAVLRQDKVCDQAPTKSESAFLLGEQQGKALLEGTEKTVLPTIPKTQCNTDIIASTILAEAKKKVDSFIKSNPLCAGYSASSLAETVDLTKEEGNRSKGLSKGLTAAYDALRVRLVSTWKCEPPPPPPDPCLCYARYSGQGPVYCFPKSKFSHLPPSWGGELAQMAQAGIQQCQGNTQSATPVGSPLVMDLDSDGIRLSSTTRVSFDLAATGEPVRMPALEGDDALLVLDVNENGRIDSGAELFGNASPCGEGRCTDGVEALAQHDANQDSVLDARDPAFRRLRLWRDSNHDGKAQARELAALSSAAVRAIRLETHLDRAWTDGYGNSATRSLSFERADGQRGEIHDVWFALSFDRLPADPRSSGIVPSRARR